MASSSSRDIERELKKAIEVQGEPELRREMKRYALEIRDEIRATATEDMDKGYQTGNFVDSVHAKFPRRRGRLPSARIFSNDPIAHLLEFGTEDTPTYGTFEKVAHRHGGTLDSREDEDLA